MHWLQELKESFRTPQELCRSLQLPELAHAQGLARFPIQVTESFLSRMTKGDPHDPLFLQVWPRPAEDEEKEGYSGDCLGEQAIFYKDGLVDKYQARSLVITTGACAIHCRYCFRRDFPYESERSRKALAEQLHQHLEEKKLDEIILSGGDPFVLTTSALKQLLQPALAKAELKIVRFHTRIPVVLPQRFDDELLQYLREVHALKKVVMVIHCNHPQEIDAEVADSLRRIREVGITLLNQSVLLKGINDTVEVLAKLSHKLFAAGVLPYYLHQLDKVEGGHHFEVDIDRGLRIMRELADQLPGYLLPRYVQEVPGASAKQPV